MTSSYTGRHTVLDVKGGCVSICYLVLGVLDNNTYVVDDGAGGAIVVDPCTDAPAIVALAGERPVSAIFVTHHHFDHTGALNDLRLQTGADVYASDVDAYFIEHPQPGFHNVSADACPVDHRLQDGDTVTIGATTWQVLLTPGHTKGGVCYYVAPSDGTDGAGHPVLLSGDTLFYGSVGRTDFEDGSMDDMRLSMRKLRELPDDTIVLPGHGDTTTIGAERPRVIDRL